MTITSASTDLRFPVDSEHGGVRLAVLVAFLATAAVLFVVANTLIPSQGFNIIAGLVGFAGAVGVSRLVEPVIKARWPSGRKLEVNADSIRLTRHSQTQVEIGAFEPVHIHLWRFPIKRRARVPKGWYVMACALEQDDNWLALYTFAAPDQSANLAKDLPFPVLIPPDSKQQSESLRVAGEQRRLLTAEQHRWHDGAEMQLADFEQFARHLKERFPQWIPGGH
jgi:hypothetical protein